MISCRLPRAILSLDDVSDASPRRGSPMDFDVVIQGGSIIDGTGSPRFRADIGLRKGRIEALATPGSLTGERGRTVDAGGLCVAPGFVDIHSHTDWVLTLPDHEKVLAPMVA